MKTILVPTDYSRCSENAIDYAVSLAKKTKAEIVLLHVYNVPSPPPELTEAVSLFSFTKNHEELMSDIVKHQKITHEDFPEMQLRVDLKIGDTVSEILKASEFYKAGMIVMGTQGASGLSKYLLGSNTAKVINKTSVPVLAVPLAAKFLGFDKIVFAAGLRNVKDYGIFDALIEIALLFNSQVKIVTVQESKGEMVHYYDSNEETEVDNIFQKVKIPYQFYKIIAKDVAQSIHDFVLQNHADLLVTMSGKHGFFELRFNKSITRELVFHNDIPVLALPERK